jgi:hypothetical protein
MLITAAILAQPMMVVALLAKSAVKKGATSRMART